MPKTVATMKRLRATTAWLLCLALWQAGPDAINRRLEAGGHPTRDGACTMAAHDAERQQFHARYVVAVNSPMVDGFASNGSK